MFNFITYKFEDFLKSSADLVELINTNANYLEFDLTDTETIEAVAKRFYNFCALRYHGATLAYNTLNDFCAKFLLLMNFNFNEIYKNYKLEQQLINSDLSEFTHGDLNVSEISNAMNTVRERENARELEIDRVHSTQTRDQVIRSEARAILDFFDSVKPFELNEFFANRRAGISFDDLFIRYIPFVPTFFEKEVH